VTTASLAGEWWDRDVAALSPPCGRVAAMAEEVDRGREFARFDGVNDSEREELGDGSDSVEIG
jgi:hypothetical protein